MSKSLPLAYVCDCGVVAGNQTECPRCGRIIQRKGSRKDRQILQARMRGKQPERRPHVTIQRAKR